jgi:hypothetical protein
VEINQVSVQVRVGEPWIAFTRSADGGLEWAGGHRTRRQAVRAAGQQGTVDDAREIK